MYYFATYFDKNYLSRGIVVADSLRKLNVDFKLYVLALDEFTYDFFKNVAFEEIEVFSLLELENFDKDLLTVKPNRKKSEYFFTLTPSLINYTFSRNAEIDILTYIDADIYFFKSPKVIYDELAQSSILIVPHNFSPQNQSLEIYGKFNVVFNMFRNDEKGKLALGWWREKCLEWCHDYLDGDRYADQKYLDQFPLLFEGVVITKNKGVNLAGFNIDNFVLNQKAADIKVDEDLLVFYHFHHLLKVNNLIFRPYKPGVWSKSVMKSKVLENIYLNYVLELKKAESKFDLKFGNTHRFSSNRHINLFKDIFIYDNILLVSTIYRGFVHLSFFHKAYTFFKKRVFKIN